ncbi:MAG: hypothetical protein H0V29_08505 [Thermoleophilaceae bacterium]|nr:hypothetical protein [Thermoleophilaceae bacterium]
MGAIHVTVGILVLATNALAAGWGGVAWARKKTSVWFWYLLRAAQATVVVQALIGLVLVIDGRDPPDSLHYIYGIAPLFISLFAEALRYGSVQKEMEGIDDPESLPRSEQVMLARKIVIREMGTMTVGTLLIVTLSLRAAVSG